MTCPNCEMLQDYLDTDVQRMRKELQELRLDRRLTPEESEKLQAECAVMRQALEGIDSYHSSGHVMDFRKCVTCDYLAVLRKSSAGTEMLERVKRLEKVAEAAKKVKEDYEDPQFALEDLMNALAELENGK